MLLIIRHDIIPQKFYPNNPSISPQLANLNVLANLKGHDLQIVGNIWIFPQELSSSFFIKYKCFHFGARCVTLSTNRSSYQKWGLCYIQIELGLRHLFCGQRPHTQWLFTIFTLLRMPHGGPRSWDQSSGHREYTTAGLALTCKLDLTLHPQEKACEWCWLTGKAYLCHLSITKSILLWTLVLFQWNKPFKKTCSALGSSQPCAKDHDGKVSDTYQEKSGNPDGKPLCLQMPHQRVWGVEQEHNRLVVNVDRGDGIQVQSDLGKKRQEF